jgi:predicted small secreted protein
MYLKKYFLFLAFLLLAFLLAACAGVGQISSGSENVTVRVVGVGSTYEEAKKNGCHYLTYCYL